ncbi:glicosidase [Trichosporon asahii var. asahii CBS 2479]|uniref:Glicosidase n=1 Tax=Trichosporon asahii var. asahii (strain ATCC 90039 / CBS 2479 / JCM 2466 / KCTC 7840 / NBRC 103889/ NCYC 2677 / UAMH 7654) TaxID=1186058 RepID=J5QH17_TRIAS|nr:glicosidase [Trichosporon asahii var. asahii CBS 2479]EJT47313.1 glicosidase [Trichosporon asahii var. asahii CBS 2479]
MHPPRARRRRRHHWGPRIPSPTLRTSLLFDPPSKPRVWHMKRQVDHSRLWAVPVPGLAGPRIEADFRQHSIAQASMVVERELSGWELAGPLTQAPITSLTLQTSDSSPRPGFTYSLSFPLPNAIRVLLVGPERPAPPHSNVILDAEPLPFTAKQVDTCKVVIAFPTKSDCDDLHGAGRKREARLDWSDSLLLSVWEELAGEWVRLSADLPCRLYALTEHGVMRHWLLPRSNVHFGLGEKGAPLDLSGRSFSISATDAACYDAYNGDPLYKHTPFLISAPRPKPDQEMPSTYAIYHASNSNAAWDLGRLHDDPWGYFKTFTQDHGGLEEWLLFGKGPKEVTRTWAEIVGRPLLVGRDWLGYLASGMGLGESFSSGYTVGPDGNRYVFTMNKERYPDFAGLVAGLHRAGIKVVPNVKPSNALFYDPHTKRPVVTRIWSSGVGVNGRGSWVDMTSEAGRKWWADGVRGLIELGVDGMWNHERAEPTNAWLGWGAFASDANVYEDLEGFDAWIGEGQLLSVPQLWEGGLTRDVYFPQAGATDDSLYFDLHPPHRTFRAGTHATIATPLEHMGLFAREGAVIPVGKSYHTVTQREGPGRTTPDGIDVVLEDEGGVVGLDDWRGVELFPGYTEGKTYTGEWVEDDGISAPPVRARVELTYTSGASGASVKVKARWLEHAFRPAWGSTLAVLLPVGDTRRVVGAEQSIHEGRTAFAVRVS